MATSQQERQLIKYLKDIELNAPESLQGFVAQDILEADNPLGYLEDLLNYGCACGMVGRLIYYRDTHAFFDRYYDEIEEIREDIEENQGCPIDIKGDLKNFLAWLGYEETARQFYLEACE